MFFVKKWIAILLLASILATGLCSCASFSSTSAAPGSTSAVQGKNDIYAPYAGTELTFLRHSGYEADWMAEKAAEFYEISGIKVTVEQIAYSEMKNKILLDISSSGGAYDMIATTEYWLSEFNEGGWLTDMTPFLKDSTLTDEAFEADDIAISTLEANTIDGQLLAMPWKFNGQLLTYRSDLIDTPPSTWEEYLAIAEEYTSGDMVGVSLALSLNSIMDIYLNLLYQAGGTLLNEANTACMLDSPEAAEALEYLIDLNQYTTSGATNNQWPESAAVFQQGNAVLYPTITSQLSSLIDPEKSAVYEDVGYSELPGGVACLSTWGVSITSNCKSPEAAWLFIQFMLNPENTKDLVLATEGADIPVRSSLLLAEDLNASYEHFAIMNDIVSTEGHTWAYPKTNCTTAIMEALAVHVQNAILGTESIEQALSSAKAEIDALLAD